MRRASIRCRSPGAIRACRNAATASRARSCRPRRCSSRSPSPPTRRSRPRCPATSAAAAPTRASRPPSSRRRAAARGGHEMNTSTTQALEPHVGTISRRAFLGGTTGGAVGGFVLGLGWAEDGQAQEAQKFGAYGMPNGVVENPLVFVSIAEDGIVTITCHRAEMGQGVRTGVPLILADEMDADWSKVRVAQAPGDEARYGNQDTDGSR